MLEKILRVELLEALPACIKSQALATNKSSTVQILMCTYTNALSGEAQTRAALLKGIESPLRQAKTAGQAANALRDWIRSVSLACERGAKPEAFENLRSCYGSH